MGLDDNVDRTAPRGWLLPAAFAWSLAVLAFVEWNLGSSGLANHPYSLLSDLRAGPACFGSLATHAILCSSDRRRKLVLRIGVALEIIRYIVLIRADVPLNVVVFSTGYGFLAASLTDFILHREWRAAALAALVPVGMASAPLGLAGIVRRLTPLTFDGTLFSLDATLRLPISKWAGGLIEKSAAARVTSLIAYAALPAAIAAGLAYEEYSNRRGLKRGVGVNLLLAYTISGTVAALLYVLCPGTGPAHAFTGFPSELPDPSRVKIGLAPFAPLSPRNAMPSLHFAWAVLLARSLGGARLSLRLIAYLFVAAILVATIGSGEHYVFDIVAAVPFLVALEALTAHRSVPVRSRITPFIVGTLFFGLWIFIIRQGDDTLPALRASPFLVWSLAAVSIVGPFAVALRSSVWRRDPRRSVEQMHAIGAN